MGNWIAIDRDIRKHWIWEDSSKFKAWIDLLMLANWEDKKLLIDNNLEVLTRGTFFFSELKLASRWGWSRNKTRRFLNLLISDQMLIANRTKNGTTLSIVNYERYQTPTCQAGQQTEQQTKQQKDNRKTTCGTTDGTQINNITNKQVNNSTRIKLPFALIEAQEVWSKFLKYRKEIKKPVSRVSQKSLLEKWAALGADQFSKAIEQTIQNGWVGIFEVKEQKQFKSKLQQKHEKENELIRQILGENTNG